MPMQTAEHELVPYSALRSLPAHRLLVLAPHPDDEVLGCGGLIAATLAERGLVQVLIVSDGGRGGDPDERERESRAAAAVLADGRPGLELSFWRLPDRAVADEPALVSRLQHLVRSTAPDAVLVPSPFEIHPDHRAVCLAGLHALRGAGPCELLFYEIGQALMPDLLVDITPQLALKRAALRCFASQMAGQAYDEQLLGLNRFRAYTLGPAVTHAEAFQRVPAQAVSGGVPAVLHDIEGRLRRRLGG